jgi:hypothetical protein
MEGIVSTTNFLSDYTNPFGALCLFCLGQRDEWRGSYRLYFDHRRLIVDRLLTKAVNTAIIEQKFYLWQEAFLG